MVSVTLAGSCCIDSLVIIVMGLLWLIPDDKMTGLIILGSGLGSLMLSCCCYSVHRCTEIDDEEETAEEVIDSFA